MREMFLRVVLSVILLLCCPAALAAEADGTTSDTDLPSAALLEFVADLETMDDETWDLLEYHALQDAAQQQQEVMQ